MKNSYSIKSLYILSLISVCVAVVISSCGHNSGKAHLPGRELTKLNKAIKASDLYMREKDESIERMKKQYDSIPRQDCMSRWEKASEIASAYLPVRADSSLHYAEIAYDISKRNQMPEEMIKSSIARVNALSTAGIFARAVNEFDSIRSAQLSPSLKLAYWSAGRKLYGYMRAYVEGDVQFFSEYSAKYYQYDDSLFKYLPATDHYREFYQAEKLVGSSRYAEAKKILERLCDNLPEESNLYAMAAFQLGVVYKNEGKPTEYASYMARAAISDIKGCVKDGLALPTLAEWLYHEGELNLAFNYINFALEDAMSGNVRMRTVSIAALLPFIDEAYREKINASRDELMIYFLLVTFLLLITIGLVVVLMRVVRRGREYSKKLARTAELQETYIGHFIGLSSIYANRLDSLNKLVTRKLASGQVEELQQLIKSGKFAQQDDDEFYKIFDNAFLEIYPDFIDRINRLLRPDEQILIKNSKELTPELRIYAFVRLGVEESTRIAQILNYSVSTVYAYRNRMRHRAIDREHFDVQVQNIGKESE